jgi:hypothetical protein
MGGYKALPTPAGERHCPTGPGCQARVYRTRVFSADRRSGGPAQTLLLMQLFNHNSGHISTQTLRPNFRWSLPMRTSFKTLLAALTLISLALSTGCGGGCGFDCNRNDDNPNGKAFLSLGFSDALPEELDEVVLKVDKITFVRNNTADVVVDTFTIDELDLVDADSFEIDLLDYPGVKQLLVIDELELEPGLYSNVVITVLADDINDSYVQEKTGDRRALTVSGNLLNVSGADLTSGAQDYSIEFGLPQALQFLEGSDTYVMTNNGMRMENTETAARLSGTVQASLFDTESQCSEKTLPLTGNRLYLYKDWDLSTDDLADVFADDTLVPDDAIAPFAVATIEANRTTGNFEYAFGYIPAGDYTLAFACDTSEDEALFFDDLLIPLPSNQTYEVTLTEGDQTICNVNALPATDC